MPTTNGTSPTKPRRPPRRRGFPAPRHRRRQRHVRRHLQRRATLARYRDAAHTSHQVTTALDAVAEATGAPSRVLATARQVVEATGPATLSPDPPQQPQPDALDPVRDEVDGPLQRTLHSLGITSPALLAQAAGLDHASQRLLIDAAGQLPATHPRPHPQALNTTAASAALLNHALATGGPHAAQLLRPGQAERDQAQAEP